MEKVKLEPDIKAEQPKSFDSFDDIPKDPKQEGLRPDRQYAGGPPDETISVAGKKYKKQAALTAYIRDFTGQTAQTRPYTEKEYYSHSTEGVGPGPGWDFRRGYMKDGWGIDDGDPSRLSDLPLYELVPVE